MVESWETNESLIGQFVNPCRKYQQVGQFMFRQSSNKIFFFQVQDRNLPYKTN